MVTSNQQVKPPDYLKPSTKNWFSQIADEYRLESHHLRLLEMASQAWDEFVDAREEVAQHGLIFMDRYGQPRERPEVATARHARTSFARLVRELGLDVEPPASRPPRIGGQVH